MLSVATSSALLSPYLQEAPALVLLMFFGSAIGSLIPDVDARDAAIFHENVKGLDHDFGQLINKLIGPILPVFGYTTKYFIYKPAVKLFDLILFEDYGSQEKHRSFSHSVLGVLTMTAVTGLYLAPLLIYLDIFAPIYLAGFLGAYAFGAFMHMLEDSATKTGIAWNSPFSAKKIKGEITTGTDIKKPRYFLFYLGSISLAIFVFSGFFTYPFPDIFLSAVSIGVLSLSWFGFMKFIAKARFTV